MNTISLRDITLKDASIIYQWKQDEYVQKMALDEHYTPTLDDQRQDIEHALESEEAEYKMILLDSKPIGYVRIDYMDSEYQYAWLRFSLGKERGKGYGHRALGLYFESLFKQGVRRIEGEVYEYNIPSQKTLEKLGFVKEGIKRKAHLYKGEYIDIYLYGLLEEEYIKPIVK